MRRYLRLIACLAWIPAVAAAGTVTYWKGNTSSDWHDPTNWDAAVPGAGYDALIQDPTSNPVTVAAAALADSFETGTVNSVRPLS